MCSRIWSNTTTHYQWASWIDEENNRSQHSKNMQYMHMSAEKLIVVVITRTHNCKAPTNDYMYITTGSKSLQALSPDQLNFILMFTEEPNLISKFLTGNNIPIA